MVVVNRTRAGHAAVVVREHARRLDEVPVVDRPGQAAEKPDHERLEKENDTDLDENNRFN